MLYYGALSIHRLHYSLLGRIKLPNPTSSIRSRSWIHPLSKCLANIKNCSELTLLFLSTRRFTPVRLRILWRANANAALHPSPFTRWRWLKNNRAFNNPNTGTTLRANPFGCVRGRARNMSERSLPNIRSINNKSTLFHSANVIVCKRALVLIRARALIEE